MPHPLMTVDSQSDYTNKVNDNRLEKLLELLEVRLKTKKEQRLIFLMKYDECRNQINQLQEMSRNLERNIILTDGEMSELTSIIDIEKNHAF